MCLRSTCTVLSHGSARSRACVCVHALLAHALACAVRWRVKTTTSATSRLSLGVWGPHMTDSAACGFCVDVSTCAPAAVIQRAAPDTVRSDARLQRAISVLANMCSVTACRIFGSRGLSIAANLHNLVARPHALCVAISRAAGGMAGGRDGGVMGAW